MSSKGNQTNFISLSSLQPGECARVRGYRKGNFLYRQRLLSMGLTMNTLFCLKRIAPLGDPLYIEVRHFLLSLRKKEADILVIERESNDGC